MASREPLLLDVLTIRFAELMALTVNINRGKGSRTVTALDFIRDSWATPADNSAVEMLGTMVEFARGKGASISPEVVAAMGGTE